MQEVLSHRQLLIIALVSVFWHFILFFAPWKYILPLESPSVPDKLSLEQIDQTDLNALRRKWKQRSLLLGDQPKKSTIPAPDHARYFSNQNRKVEKETRAKVTDVIPKPGGGSQMSNLGVEMLNQTQTPEFIKRTQNSKLKTKITTVNKTVARSQSQSKAGPSATIGMDQSIIDPTLPEDQQNLLNTRESIHYSFFSRVYQAIAPLWQDRIRSTRVNRPLVPKDYIAKVKVTLDKEGNVASVDFISPSGVPEFDRAFDWAWRKINRFPNPPKELLKNGKLEMGWNIAVTVRSPNDFNP